jgi:acetate---CoA ligase (ADP-forming) subunit beta
MIRNQATEVIRSAIKGGRLSLLENEAEEVAKEYGIKVEPSGIAHSEKESVSLARKLSFPVVMKIVSPDILHKSDIGGVKANISSIRETTKAYREIRRNAKKANSRARIEGVLVQKMALKGTEFVVGATRDPQFGPTIMFGLGGVYVELFKDVAFRLAPITEEEALGMMKEIKSYPLLTGFRGAQPLDMKESARAIIAVGRIMLDQPQIESIDINPLLIYPKGVMAVDVRIILAKGKGQQEILTSK